MPDYQKGKVYRILQDNEKTVYIGSTTQELSARMGQHRKGLVNYPHLKLYKLMAEVGVDRFTIELIVDCPCERREILTRAEGEQIRLHGTIADGCNQNVAGQTIAEYEQLPENRARRLERGRQPERKAHVAAYRNRPEVKAKRAENARRPEIKAKMAEIDQRPERKEKKREYRQLPEVKAKWAAYRQLPEIRAKQAEYDQRPEVKAMKAERTRLYRQRKRAAAAEVIVQPVDAAPV